MAGDEGRWPGAGLAADLAAALRAAWYRDDYDRHAREVAAEIQMRDILAAEARQREEAARITAIHREQDEYRD